MRANMGCPQGSARPTSRCGYSSQEYAHSSNDVAGLALHQAQLALIGWQVHQPIRKHIHDCYSTILESILVKTYRSSYRLRYKYSAKL
jgi:hypothetical protein